MGALVNPKSSPGLSTPEFVDKSVSCPLLEACSPLNVPTLCRLLSQGCDPNLTSSRGRNPLHLPSPPLACCLCAPTGRSFPRPKRPRGQHPPGQPGMPSGTEAVCRGRPAGCPLPCLRQQL